ncbi:hypothetical protein Pelo_5398 [Pelomyxa schiedti]|nr:hypothetical protein Pelo_5398 [Pelomyxa schiedti]
MTDGTIRNTAQVIEQLHTFMNTIQKGWEFANELRERINDTKDNHVPAKHNFKPKSFKVGDRRRAYVAAEGRSGDKPHEVHEDNMFQWNDPADGPLLPSTTTDYLPLINNKKVDTILVLGTRLRAKVTSTKSSSGDTLMEPSVFMVANWSHVTGTARAFIRKAINIVLFSCDNPSADKCILAAEGTALFPRKHIRPEQNNLLPQKDHTRVLTQHPVRKPPSIYGDKKKERNCPSTGPPPE